MTQEVRGGGSNEEWRKVERREELTLCLEKKMKLTEERQWATHDICFDWSIALFHVALT